MGEYLNSITHLIGAALALVGLGALLSLALLIGDWRMLLGHSVFGASMVLLYSMSTLYHSFKPSLAKRVFRKLDHVSIYLLIAGTYTPIILVGVQNQRGYNILIAVWALAIIGMVVDSAFKQRKELISLLIYVSMGWACLVDFGNIIAKLSPQALWWLIAGGITYTTGIIFYLLDNANKLSHAHGIWHFFVMAGTACHFVCIIAYLR